MESVRIYEMPNCKMVSSQCGMFGDGKLEKFIEWVERFPRPMFPKTFLKFDNERNGFVFYFLCEDGIAVPDDFDMVDFPGGLYAVATDVDGQDDTPARSAIKDFIRKTSCFEEDPSREMMGNIITPPSAFAAMGYNQMDYYTPIRVIEK